MGVVLYELCNLQHAFQGEVRMYNVYTAGWTDTLLSLGQRKCYVFLANQ